MVKQTTSSTPKRKYTIKDQEKYSASRTKHVKKNAAHALLSLQSMPSISREDAAESMLSLHSNAGSNMPSISREDAAQSMLSLHSNALNMQSMPSISREDAAESMLRLHSNTHGNTQSSELFPNPYASPYGINIPLSRYVIPPPPDYPPPPVPNYPSSFSRGGKSAKRRSRRRKNKR
jgi:ATP-dependent Clp protease adapter protein ClpS